MIPKVDAISRYVWLPVAFVLPAVLLLSSVLTFRELDEMRAVYLRNHAATIAARLEGAPAPKTNELYAQEPALLDFRTYEERDGSAGSAGLDAIWSGRELFRTEMLSAGGRPVFRAYIPFHSDNRMRIARIDLAASAADFLLLHARHNLIVAGMTGLVLVLLSLYVVWSARRAAALEHLAQLGGMSAVLAHEIRNPLGTIKGFAQLAGQRADPDMAELLAPLLEEVARLEKLVKDLLLYGRPVTPSVREAEWQPLARELEMNARQAVNGRTVAVAMEKSAWRFRTDPDLLKQVLLNLLRNAIEAVGEMPEGLVRLTVEPEGRGALIAVEDNGPGIPDSARARLFEPFHTTKASGTGLGLSISRKLTRALGGRLELRAAAGGGTRAELVFPRLKLEPADGNHPHR